MYTESTNRHKIILYQRVNAQTVKRKVYLKLPSASSYTFFSHIITYYLAKVDAVKRFKRNFTLF